MHRLMVALMVGSLVSLVGGFAGAQSKAPDATLELSEGSMAAGIGFTWGKGTLTYQGQKYPVKIEGRSVGEVGIQRAAPRSSAAS